MNSPEHNSPFHKIPRGVAGQPLSNASRPAYGSSPQAPYQPVPEDLLASGEIAVERKIFQMALKENQRGRLLRITEHKGHIRETIIIPATGLKEFQNLLAEMIAEDARIPQKVEPNPPTAPEA